jgi:hypothetical protein
VAYFASQKVSHTYPLTIETLVFVGPLDDDRSIDLDSSVETARFQICEHWRLSLVHFRFEDTAQSNGSSSSADFSTERTTYFGECFQCFLCVYYDNAIVDIDSDQEAQPGSMKHDSAWSRPATVLFSPDEDPTSASAAYPEAGPHRREDGKALCISYDLTKSQLPTSFAFPAAPHELLTDR